MFTLDLNVMTPAICCCVDDDDSFRHIAHFNIRFLCIVSNWKNIMQNSLNLICLLVFSSNVCNAPFCVYFR